MFHLSSKMFRERYIPKNNFTQPTLIEYPWASLHCMICLLYLPLLEVSDITFRGWKVQQACPDWTIKSFFPRKNRCVQAISALKHPSLDIKYFILSQREADLNRRASTWKDLFQIQDRCFELDLERFLNLVQFSMNISRIPVEKPIGNLDAELLSVVLNYIPLAWFKSTLTWRHQPSLTHTPKSYKMKGSLHLWPGSKLIDPTLGFLGGVCVCQRKQLH